MAITDGRVYFIGVEEDDNSVKLLGHYKATNFRCACDAFFREVAQSDKSKFNSEDLTFNTRKLIDYNKDDSK